MSKLTESLVRQLEVEFDPDEDGWTDRFHAVWYPEHKDSNTASGGYWMLWGANSGSDNGMIIHPYQIAPLIELLNAMRAGEPDRG